MRRKLLKVINTAVNNITHGTHVQCLEVDEDTGSTVEAVKRGNNKIVLTITLRNADAGTC